MFKTIEIAKIILLSIILILLVLIIVDNPPKNDRYKVLNDSPMNITVLLDSATGLTWRNTKCGEKSDDTPNCWQIMDHPEEDFTDYPIGVQDKMKIKNKSSNAAQKK